MAEKRTWSRQTAWALMIGCAALAYSGKTEELRIVIWPVTAFVLPAFSFRQPVVSEWMRGRPS